MIKQPKSESGKKQYILEWVQVWREATKFIGHHLLTFIIPLKWVRINYDFLRHNFFTHVNAGGSVAGDINYQVFTNNS